MHRHRPGKESRSRYRWAGNGNERGEGNAADAEEKGIMSHAIRETEGKADRAGLVVADLHTAIANAKREGWDTTDLEAQLKEASRATAVAIRDNNVARFKALGAQGGEDARNERAADLKHFEKAQAGQHHNIRELRNIIREASQRGEDTTALTEELMAAQRLGRRNTAVVTAAKAMVDGTSSGGAIEAPALIKHRGGVVTTHTGGIAAPTTTILPTSGAEGVNTSPHEAPDAAAPANDA
jgi:hypothetical protein